jgi:hypothetical protein
MFSPLSTISWVTLDPTCLTTLTIHLNDCSGNPVKWNTCPSSGKGCIVFCFSFINQSSNEACETLVGFICPNKKTHYDDEMSINVDLHLFHLFVCFSLKKTASHTSYHHAYTRIYPRMAMISPVNIKKTSTKRMDKTKSLNPCMFS